MAGRRSWALLGGLGLAAALNPTGCDTPGPAGGSVDADALRAVLAAVGPEVMLPALDRFLGQAEALGVAVDAWAGAVAS